MAKVLLIDDDKDILNFGNKVLSSVGHKVSLAEDVASAVEILSTDDFDLIVTDANMPVHTGYDLLKILKSEQRYKNIPIALLTARREREDIEQAIKLGVDDYIVKPIDPSLFIKKVSDLLKKAVEKNPVQEKSEEEAPTLQEVSIRLPGIVKMEAEIVAVSEVGLTVQTPHQLTDGQSIHFDSNLFQAIQIKPPFMKVLNCEFHKNSNKWVSRIQFVGASDTTLQRIRAWINAETIKQRNRAA